MNRNSLPISKRHYQLVSIGIDLASVVQEIYEQNPDLRKSKSFIKTNELAKLWNNKFIELFVASRKEVK